MKSDGANTPPEPPIPMVRLVARIFPPRQQDQEPRGVAAANRRLQGRVTHAVHLGQREKENPERDTPHSRPQPLRAPPQSVDGVFRGVKGAEERDSGQLPPAGPAPRRGRYSQIGGHLERRQRQEGRALQMRLHPIDVRRPPRQITTTPKDSASKSRRMSSKANIAPAIGALNVAEIPPAAPHATRSRRRDSSNPQNLPESRTDR